LSVSRILLEDHAQLRATNARRHNNMNQLALNARIQRTESPRDCRVHLSAVFCRGGSEAQLCDLANDSSETRNPAQRHPKRAKRMSESVMEWWQSIPPAESVNARKPVLKPL
jgi:hypothetical protein